jgi:hypothetical protein
MNPRDRLLVAVDVDGTLLDSEFDDVLRESERSAVRSVREAGHVLALCTGRNRKSAADVVRTAGGALDGVPQILLNGALVLSGEPQIVLRHAGLDRAVLEPVVRLFKAHGVIPLLFGTDEDGGDIVLEPLEPNSVLGRYLDKRRDRVGHVTVVDDLLASLPAAALEVGTIDRAEVILALSEAVRAELGDAVQVVNTQSLLARDEYLWAEVYGRDCSKGSGLRLLAESLSIPLERTVGLGDNYNDLDLFATAGHSVAMGNAPADVRAAADRVAPDVRDCGAARILEEIASGAWPPARKAG